MKKKADMYVCSKPLQYFNIRNLPLDNTRTNILIIEDKFKDAKKFYESVIQYDKSWNEVLFVTDRAKILFLCLFKYKVTNFYYYLDFMLMAATFLYFLPCKNIYVYEEGISAYRTSIFNNTAKYKRKIRKFLGMSEYAGQHPRVKGIYVYNIEKYLQTFSFIKNKSRLKPLAFKTSFQKMLENNLDLALKIFRFDPDKTFSEVRDKKVLFYITTWPIDAGALNKIHANDYDYYIIKPHPHIRELSLPESWKNDKTIVIDSVILAEFLIEILIERNNKVDIYHHNSSAVMYVNQHPNINSVISI